MNTLKSIAAADVNHDGKFSPPEDGFIQAFPFGEFPGVVEFRGKPEGIPDARPSPAGDGRWELEIIQVLDAEAVRDICSAGVRDLLIDYEHSSTHPAGDSRAAAWVANAEAREDGLYVLPRWTADGEQDVRGGHYRYTSPVFPWESMVRLSGNRYRPTRMSSLALTNCPNIRNIRAVSNSAPQKLSAGVSAADSAPVVAAPKPKENDMRDKLIAVLGLPAEAADEQIIAAIEDMAKRLSDAEQAQLDAQVEADLDEHAPIIANRVAVKAALIKDRPGTLAVLNAISKSAPPTAKNMPATSATSAAKNTSGAKVPQVAARDRSAERLKFVSQVQKDYSCRNRQQAWSKAVEINPELFND